MTQLFNGVYQATDGKVLKNKNSGVIVGSAVLLAKTDSIQNYEEIDKPVETPVETSEETPTETIIEN